MLKRQQQNPLLFWWFWWLAVPSGSVSAAEALPSQGPRASDSRLFFCSHWPFEFQTLLEYPAYSEGLEMLPSPSVCWQGS